jgi:hypothetical protein
MFEFTPGLFLGWGFYLIKSNKIIQTLDECEIFKIVGK